MALMQLSWPLPKQLHHMSTAAAAAAAAAVSRVPQCPTGAVGPAAPAQPAGGQPDTPTQHMVAGLPKHMPGLPVAAPLQSLTSGYAASPISRAGWSAPSKLAGRARG
jgi:hypothetical protein